MNYLTPIQISKNLFNVHSSNKANVPFDAHKGLNQFSLTQDTLQISFQGSKCSDIKFDQNILNSLLEIGIGEEAPVELYTGKRTRIEYKENGLDKTIQGPVVFISPVRILILDEKTQQIKDIDYYNGDVSSIKMNTDESPWNTANVVLNTMTLLQLSNYYDQVPMYMHTRLIEQLSSFKFPYILIASNNDKNTDIVTGEVIDSSKFPLLRIKRANQKPEIIDINQFDCMNTHILLMQKGKLQNKQYWDQLDTRTILPLQGEELSSDKARRNLINKLFADLTIKNISPFDNSSYYSYFEKRLDETEQLINRWYKDKSAELISKVKNNLSEKDLVLLLDPAIATRLDELCQFVEEKGINTDKLTPFKLRQKFSDHLGEEIVYRGITLTKEDAKYVKENGNYIPSIDKEDFIKSLMFETIHPSERTPIFLHGNTMPEEIWSKVKFSDNSLYLSASSYEEFASSVGYHCSPAKDKKNVKPYLIKAKIPVLSTVKLNNIFELGHKKDVIHNLKGKNYNPIKDPSVEIFIPFNIPLTDKTGQKSFSIKEIKKPEEFVELQTK